MARTKEIMKKLLHPHPVLTVLISLASFGALIWVFLTGQETRWFAYPIFVMAFYSLVILCVWGIPAVIGLAKRKQQKENEKEQAVRDKELKKSVRQHLVINTIFGIGHIIQGCWVGSAWIGANGIYNLAFAVSYMILASYEAKLGKAEESQRRYLAWKGYRNCGFTLLGLNLSMTGIAFQTIWWGRGRQYSEIMVIAVAAFTFYKLTMAIIRVVQCRKNDSPILGAAKNMTLTESLMSLFSLQAALLTTFGDGFEQAFLLNTLTGGAVCLSTMLGGLGMVFHGVRKMKESQGEKEHG